MSGGIAGRGRPGARGPAGPMGPTGPQGAPAFTLSIGTVDAVPYGQQPEVTNVGTEQDQIWNFSLVTGATGVLVGAQPPTGTDGTSLGQLYFCTANQTYYGLIELNENDNKWRPIMTNEANRIELDSDIIVQNTLGATSFSNVGRVTYIFDEVRQELAIGVYMHYNQPIAGSNVVLGIDREVMEKVRAMCASRVASVAIPYQVTVNGVTTTKTLNALGEGWPVQLVGSATAGSGEDPGYKVKWEDGRIVLDVNETGAPGGSVYGNAAKDGRESALWTSVFTVLEADPDYVSNWFMAAMVVIPYD